MGGVGAILTNAAGSRDETKWDKFNNDAHMFFEGLICRGLITGYEIRNYVSGKMNCFFMFQTDKLKHDTMLHREVARSFKDMWLSYGITDDDMLFDNQMGLVFTTEDRFEKDERSVSLWVDTV